MSKEINKRTFEMISWIDYKSTYFHSQLALSFTLRLSPLSINEQKYLDLGMGEKQNNNSK